MMKLYAPFIKEVTLRVTMTLRSEGHGGDPSPKLQGGLRERESERNRQKEFQKVSTVVVQYKKKGRTPTNERTTNEIPFNTSAGARAMHGFGAEVCVEEVQ